jgi:hypothetical protein
MGFESSTRLTNPSGGSVPDGGGGWWGLSLHLGSQTLQVGQFLTEVEADGVWVLTWAHKPFRWVSPWGGGGWGANPSPGLTNPSGGSGPDWGRGRQGLSPHLSPQTLQVGQSQRWRRMGCESLTWAHKPFRWVGPWLRWRLMGCESSPGLTNSSDGSVPDPTKEIALFLCTHRCVLKVVHKNQLYPYNFCHILTICTPFRRELSHYFDFLFKIEIWKVQIDLRRFSKYVMKLWLLFGKFCRILTIHMSFWRGLSHKPKSDNSSANSDNFSVRQWISVSIFFGGGGPYFHCLLYDGTSKNILQAAMSHMTYIRWIAWEKSKIQED